MASGGARNRSGPQPDPASGRSDRRGLAFNVLPADGYDGKAPDWPLRPRRVMRWELEDKRRYQVLDIEATEAVRAREAELWEWAWSTPQAAAWSRESWRWQTIAMWVRTFVICESDEATAADKSAVHRFGDQIGLTPAGLKENGWQIAAPEATSTAKPEKAATRGGSRARLGVIQGGAS